MINLFPFGEIDWRFYYCNLYLYGDGSCSNLVSERREHCLFQEMSSKERTRHIHSRPSAMAISSSLPITSNSRNKSRMNHRSNYTSQNWMAFIIIGNVASSVLIVLANKVAMKGFPYPTALTTLHQVRHIYFLFVLQEAMSGIKNPIQ